jgi:lysozyme family protein
MVTFDSCFDKVLGHEGGYVNDPHDPGGETKFGISKRTYPNEDIAALTLARAKEIYRRDYWDRLRADDLPAGLRYYLFDTAVNCGVGFAAESLQRAAGALPDGAIGPRSLIAINTKGPQSLLRLMFVDRALRYALNPNDRRYGAGWFARLYDVTVLTLVAIDPRLEVR